MEDASFSLRAETQQLREQYNAQLRMDSPSPRLQFEYACLLSCSPSREEIRESLELFDELLEIGFTRADCLFQISLAYLKLGEYNSAKRRVETLLRLEPRNLSALSLHSLIIDRASHDGLIGSVLMGLAVGGCLWYLMRSWASLK
ncbi:putative tetratricopeptide repeat protein 11 [Besnoitia besnoiti]|uniref:Putative tetratricopeptide repeat protein 11 n=1 Tax=Besnoitia besnoiti TaxID=94643 RepID=A0A2A9MP27_BESBE|nr:putative tetratricopeptide repeat protein 11 [Besnoitia besnoiti]PFH37737.1 putative tetratricopeptide repeat protein 11 [Besnoitia besnoiti]